MEFPGLAIISTVCTNTKFWKYCRRIEEIECLDKEFDANFHHAIMQEPKEGVESGIVLEEIQKGYMLKDRILRPAKVMVHMPDGSVTE